MESVHNRPADSRMVHRLRVTPNVEIGAALPVETTPAGVRSVLHEGSTTHPMDSVEMMAFTLSANALSMVIFSATRSQAYITVV